MSAARRQPGPGRIPAPEFQQRGAQHRALFYHRPQPTRLLLGIAEFRDRQAAQHRSGEERHRRHPPALLLEHDAEFEDAQPATPLGFRHGDTGEVRIGEQAPEIHVEPLATALEFQQALVGGVVGENLGGQRAHGLLFFAVRKVHGITFYETGRKSGSRSSGSTWLKSTCTGMPISIFPGSTPTRLETRRVPSSSSTSTMGLGCSKAGSGG